MSDSARYTIIMNKPPRGSLRRDNRAETLQATRDYYQAQRNRLMDWLWQQGVGADIRDMSDIGTSNTFFVTAPTNIEPTLRAAPGVKRVQVSQDFSVELLDDSSDS